MPRESAIGHWALQVGIPSACELTPDEAAREGAGQGGGGLVGLKASVSPPGLQLEGCQSLGGLRRPTNSNRPHRPDSRRQETLERMLWWWGQGGLVPRRPAVHIRGGQRPHSPSMVLVSLSGPT